MRVLASEGKLAPEVCLKIGHEKRGGDSLAGDVADQQSEALLSESQKIIVIAADMAGLDTNARVVETGHCRKRLREESGLHLYRNFQLLGGAPFQFQLLGNGATLALDLPAHLVGGDQFKGVSIYIGEGGKGPAPKLLLRRLGKMHSAAAPQLISCIDVLSDKANVRWPPDKLVVLR